MSGGRTPVVVLGAGPAGLGAALQLARRGCFDVTVIERNPEVGGNAGSFDIAGLRVDYGSHRLHPSCAPEILSDIRAMLGHDLLDRPRHGRIRLRGRWLHFPLQPVDLAVNLPPDFLLGSVRDTIFKHQAAHTEENFATVLERGLGRTICRDFYFPYARKIWGISPEELDAEQARRRVSAGSTAKMIRKILNAVPGLKPKGAGRFFYPRRGYGQISDMYACAAAKAGVSLRLQTALTSIYTENGRAAAVAVSGPAGIETLPATQIFSTIPLPVLVRAATPHAPQAVLESAAALQFRGMILIYLVLEAERFTKYDAHYFPDPGIAITRLSEPKNYGLAELPGLTVLCAELPCSLNSEVWQASDTELGNIVLQSLQRAGIPIQAKVREVLTRRLPQAYPIYTRDYHQHFTRIDMWLNGIEGLLTFGRQGLFAHDNTHHALAMAYAAARCLCDDGTLNRTEWATCRLAFEQHVVED